MLGHMRTVVVGTRPPELLALMTHRRVLGLDMFDEVWNGEYHLNPAPHSRHGRVDRQVSRALDPIADQLGLIATSAFNLGVADNYRVPDGGYLRPPTTDDVYVPTAAVVVDIISPDDETLDKLPHYAAFGVDEVVVVDCDRHLVRVFRGMAEVDESAVLGITADWLEQQIVWPE